MIIKHPLRREDVILGEERIKIGNRDLFKGMVKGFAWRG
jgi:hypothetical protein